MTNWGLDMAPEFGILGLEVDLTFLSRIGSQVRDLGAFVPGICVFFSAQVFLEGSQKPVNPHGCEYRQGTK